MSKVTIVVGLPGAGKTMYARDMVLPDTKLFDDPSLTPDSLNDLKEHIKSGGNVIITDAYMVSPEVRREAESKLRSWGATEFDWLFFENNPDACIKNIENRRDGRLVSPTYIHEASRQYVIPTGAKTVQVFKNI
jgi:predicted kinase